MSYMICIKILKFIGSIPKNAAEEYRYITPKNKILPGDSYQALDEIAKICKERGVAMLMVMDSRYEYSRGEHERIENHAKSLGFHVINLYRLYRNLPIGTSIHEAVSILDEHNLNLILELGSNKDHHPNAKWHDKTAKVLFDYLSRNELIVKTDENFAPGVSK